MRDRLPLASQTPAWCLATGSSFSSSSFQAPEFLCWGGGGRAWMGAQTDNQWPASVCFSEWERGEKCFPIPCAAYS